MNSFSVNSVLFSTHYIQTTIMLMGKEMHIFLSHLDSHEFQELWTQYSSVYHWACYLYEWFHSVEFGPAFLWQYSVCINTHANNILKWYKFYDAEFQAYIHLIILLYKSPVVFEKLECFILFRLIRQEYLGMFAPLFQLHAWWHILAGTGTYLSVLFR